MNCLVSCICGTFLFLVLQNHSPKNWIPTILEFCNYALGMHGIESVWYWDTHFYFHYCLHAFVYLKNLPTIKHFKYRLTCVHVHAVLAVPCKWFLKGIILCKIAEFFCGSYFYKSNWTTKPHDSTMQLEILILQITEKTVKSANIVSLGKPLTHVHTSNEKFFKM